VFVIFGFSFHHLPSLAVCFQEIVQNLNISMAYSHFVAMFFFFVLEFLCFIIEGRKKGE
jgi:hypothetical protein